MNTQKVLKQIAEKRLRQPFISNGRILKLLSDEIKSQGEPTNHRESVSTGMSVVKNLNYWAYKSMVTRDKSLEVVDKPVFEVEKDLVEGARRKGIPVTRLEEECRTSGGFYLAHGGSFHAHFSLPKNKIDYKEDIRAYVTVNGQEMSRIYLHFFQLCDRLLAEGVKFNAKMTGPWNGKQRKDNVIFYLSYGQAQLLQKVLLTYDQEHRIADSDEGVIGAIKMRPTSGAMAWGFELRALDQSFSKYAIGKSASFSEYLAMLLSKPLFEMLQENEILSKTAKYIGDVIGKMTNNNRSILKNYEKNIYDKSGKCKINI